VTGRSWFPLAAGSVPVILCPYEVPIFFRKFKLISKKYKIYKKSGTILSGAGTLFSKKISRHHELTGFSEMSVDKQFCLLYKYYVIKIL
jgi:hypothetical protein